MQIKIIGNTDSSCLLEEYNKILPQLEWLDSNQTKQTSLQHTKELESFTDGCGKIKIERDRFGRQKYANKETDFSVVHRIIKNTIFEELINQYKLHRTRFMIVKPKSCYSLHRDFGPRIHIPIITNPSAMFIFKDTGLHHLAVGNVYWVDTSKIHSFANFGDTERLHLIGCV
jgi:mannose-6-phosphate isomerase-like protein (cupin superfamily)